MTTRWVGLVQEGQLAQHAAKPATSTPRSAPLSMRRNFSWTLAANLIYAACQWGMLVALAKMGSPRVVGQYALALAIAAPVMLFSNLSLRTLQATDTDSKNLSFPDYLGIRLLSAPLAVFVVVGVAACMADTAATALVVFAVALAKAVEALSDLCHGEFQRRERMDLVARSLMIKGPLTFLVFSIAYFMSGALWIAVSANLSVWIAVLLLYDVARLRAVLGLEGRSVSGAERHYLTPRWRKDRIVPTLRLGLSLGAVALLISLLPNIPRYFLEHYRGEAELGVFSAVAYIAVAGGMVVNALGQSALPRLARIYDLGDLPRFRQLMARLIGLGLMLGAAGVIAAMLGGRALLAIMYTDAYSSAAGVLTWVMAGGAVSYVGSLVWYGVAAARSFHQQVAVYVVAIIVGAVACFTLVPRFGLTGAAWAYALSALAQLMGVAFILVRTLTRSEGSLVGRALRATG